MLRAWLWAALVWALLFLMPPTRPLAVRFLPLGRAWDDVLVLVAVGILGGGTVSLGVIRWRERRARQAIAREQAIRRLEHELFDEE